LEKEDASSLNEVLYLVDGISEGNKQQEFICYAGKFKHNGLNLKKVRDLYNYKSFNDYNIVNLLENTNRVIIGILDSNIYEEHKLELLDKYQKERDNLDFTSEERYLSHVAKMGER